MQGKVREKNSDGASGASQAHPIWSWPTNGSSPFPLFSTAASSGFPTTNVMAALPPLRPPPSATHHLHYFPQATPDHSFRIWILEARCRCTNKCAGNTGASTPLLLCGNLRCLFVIYRTLRLIRETGGADLSVIWQLLCIQAIQDIWALTYLNRGRKKNHSRAILVDNSLFMIA